MISQEKIDALKADYKARWDAFNLAFAKETGFMPSVQVNVAPVYYLAMQAIGAQGAPIIAEPAFEPYIKEVDSVPTRE